MTIGMCIHQGRIRCWPCMMGACYEEPTLHEWWDHEDIEHAIMTAQPAPSGWCGCAFCEEPAVIKINQEKVLP